MCASCPACSTPHYSPLPTNKLCCALPSPADGCGTLSPALTLEVAGRLQAAGRLAAGVVPSAYQIRLSGCKGMVALDPQLPGRR